MKIKLLQGIILLLINISCFAHQENINDDENNDNSYEDNSYELVLLVLDEKLQVPISGAQIVINNTVTTTNNKGQAQLQQLPNRISPTIIHKSADLIKVTTFHKLTINDLSKITLPALSAVSRKIRAQFSVTVPFGQLPSGTEHVTIVPKLQYLSGDFKNGSFSDILAYDDNLQTDEKLTLLIAAFDTHGLPIKYGFMLDQVPSLIDQRFFTLSKPHFTPIENSVLTVHWQKLSDSISRSTANSNCDYSIPPYTICGTFQPKRGLFSWVTVIRKGIRIPTPGAFLPARTQGSNPYLSLPNSVYELVGHDEPLGSFPMNFSRDTYQQFNLQTPGVIDISMPELLIGRTDQNGNDAIQFIKTDKNPILQWRVYSKGSPLPKYGIATMIWKNRKTNTSVHWQHIFEPKMGINKIDLADINNRMLHDIKSAVPVEINISLYGSNEIDNYQEILNVYKSGKSPINVGSKRFSVSRWR